ncbi:MAG: GC-type dockerin domain-anchored protein [Phycisphaerales bacterium]
MNKHTLWASALFVLAGTAGAAPVDAVIDPAQSTIDLTMTVDVGVASDTDSDSSPLSGYLRIELDDYGVPTQITLHDLLVMIDEDLEFNWSFGFLGGADATLTGGVLTWGSTDAIIGPVPITDGDFLLPQVPTALMGTLAVNYDIFLVGSGSEVMDLADQGDLISDVTGSVVGDEQSATITSTLPLDAVVPLTDDKGTQLGTLTVSGAATIVATAQAPACAADLNNDGKLNFFDISAFLSAFSSMAPAGDFNGDGMYNFFDVSGFLGAFSAGCPLR